MIRMTSVACPPIWRPKLPPVNVRNAGDDQPLGPRALRRPRPRTPPNTNPAFTVFGKIAIPAALPRMAFGIALSSADMISPNTVAPSRTRFASLSSFCAREFTGWSATTHTAATAATSRFVMER
jgi:hypothetical protein